MRPRLRHLLRLTAAAPALAAIAAGAANPALANLKLAPRLAVIAQAAAQQNIEPLMAPALTRQLFRQNSPLEARWNAAGQVQVYLHYDRHGNPPATGALAALGATDIVTSPQLGVVQAWIPAGNLTAAASMNDVTRMTIPRYAFVSNAAPVGALPRTGSVDTEGDTILGAQQFRQATGYTGQGMVVGVISDGDAGVATDQGTGDLPANIWNDPNNGSWEKAAGNTTGAEGTAMMEIVYDLAPGVKQLGFAAPATSVDFLTALNDFATDINANVIVDDLGFPGEAMFTNGSFANGVASFAAAHPNIHLVTAAGNDATAFWAGQWTAMTLSPTLTVNKITYTTALDFGAGSGNPKLSFAVQPGDTVSYIVEWNDPWDDSATANDPNGDYDAVLFNASGAAIACNQGMNVSTTNGQCNQTNSQPLNTPGPQPVQGNQWQNTGSSVANVYLEIFLVNGTPGPNPGNLGNQFKILISSQKSNQIQITPDTPAGSIFAQSALPYPTEITAGAVCETSFCGNTNQIEPYSSQGPVQFGIPGTGTGTQPAETLYKPDFVAPDCVSVTGVGGFGSPFCGTSAAGPHIAGLIALLMSAYPGSVSPYTLMLQSATPFGSATGTWTPCLATGNGIYGCGQPNMQTLLQKGIYPATSAVITSPASGGSVSSGQSVTFAGTCLGYDGSNAFSYDWNFGSSGLPDSSAQNPAVTFNTAGSYTVKLTCTNKTGSGSATSSITVTASRFGGGGSLGWPVLVVLLLLQAVAARRKSTV